MDELEQLEDDLAEDTLEFYRLVSFNPVLKFSDDLMISQRRLAEMKAKQAADKFGNFQLIGQADYKREVTEAKDVYVVLLLFMFSQPDCQLMQQNLAQLSAKHKYVKFCRIVAQDAIPNFPERNVPTILVYKDVSSQVKV